jgi:hypothetical protein
MSCVKRLAFPVLACMAASILGVSLALAQRPPLETERPETFVCSHPELYEGKVVGDGQCAVFVQKCAGAPLAEFWTPGLPVKGNDIPRGTAIATFDANGRYPNKPTGNHAAIYDGQDETGIWVYEQWKGQPVQRRHIRFKGRKGSPSNDGDAFSVIESPGKPKKATYPPTLPTPNGAYGGKAFGFNGGCGQ